MTATGISDYGYTASVTLPWSKRAKKSARSFFRAEQRLAPLHSVPAASVATFSAALGEPQNCCYACDKNCVAI